MCIAIPIERFFIVRLSGVVPLSVNLDRSHPITTPYFERCLLAARGSVETWMEEKPYVIGESEEAEHLIHHGR
jgi:hypothetical protein